MRRTGSIILVALLGAASASARSHWTDVTPSNIAGVPQEATVHCDALEHEVRFRICVSRSDRDTLMSCRADMVVYKRDVKARPGFLHNSSSRPERAAVCQVEGLPSDHTMCYELQVDCDLLHRVTLVITYSRKGNFAFDAYEIMLGEFANCARGR